MPRRFLPLSAAVLALLLAAGPSHAQAPLTLADALARAERHAYGNRIARAETDLQAARRMSALPGLLPSLRLEAGWMRTTDPLNAFGFALRQRAVSQASFDPARLNDPVPISSLGTAMVAEVPLFNADAWLGRAAAGRARDAAAAAARWARAGTAVEVVNAYYGGVLARARVAALEAGLEAARSAVRRAESVYRQGLVTRSDVLLAEVGAGEVEVELLAARGDAALAGRRLATALGTPDDTVLVLPDVLPDPARALALAADAAGTAGDRADLQAAQHGREAARLDVARATSRLVPRVNSFARYEWTDAAALASGRPAWTVGVMASWSLFGGGGELADRQEARAREDAAQARLEAAEASAALDRRERRNALDVAAAALAIAQRNLVRSGEAHRIVARKYEGGLATITDLLAASAGETRSRVELAAATWRVITAAAAWRQAIGADLTDLTLLDRSAP